MKTSYSVASIRERAALRIAVGIYRCSPSIAQERTVTLVIPDSKAIPIGEPTPVKMKLVCVDTVYLARLHQKRWKCKNVSIVVAYRPTLYLDEKAINILKYYVFVWF